jgi:Ser/Thr protein kinase RdoA (MazF antagonist)
MQPYVRELFTEDVQADCARIWGIESFGEKMGASENFVFVVRTGAGEAVLRLTHSDRRPVGQVAAELAFMRRLAVGGVPVPEILPAPSGRLFEEVEVAKGSFTGVLMERVPGTVLSRRFGRGSVLPEWIVREWGRAIGRMHRVSADCNDEGIRFERNHWDLIYGEEADPDKPEERKLERYAKARREIVDTYRSFPEEPDAFGLIHMDLHQGNIIVTEDRFTCIDFDDASYHFFIQDIAMPLYYQFLFWDDNAEERLVAFFKTFIKAYREEYRLDPAWFEHLPKFLRVRDYDLKIALALWEFPEDDPMHREVTRRMEAGNPLAGFPWRQWAELG